MCGVPQLRRTLSVALGGSFMIFGSGVSAAALFGNCAMVLSLCGRRFAGPSLDAAWRGGG